MLCFRMLIASFFGSKVTATVNYMHNIQTYGKGEKRQPMPPNELVEKPSWRKLTPPGGGLPADEIRCAVGGAWRLPAGGAAIDEPCCGSFLR